MVQQNEFVNPWLARLEMTAQELGVEHRSWYETEVRENGREADLQRLAEVLDTTVSSAQRYASPLRLPTGEFLDHLCHRIEKVRALGLEIGDPALDNDTPMLLQNRLADQIRQAREALDERELGRVMPLRS